MRILELEIINFGKFHDETVRFHDGINLIYGANEMGKAAWARRKKRRVQSEGARVWRSLCRGDAI